MKSSIWLTLALLAVTPMAFSAERYFEFVPSAEYKLLYDDGYEIAIAAGNSAIVAVTYSPADKKNAWIGISVKNISDAPFVVRESSLAAKGHGNELRVATFNELLKLQKRREFWDGVGAGANAYTNSAKAASAGNSSTSGIYSETTNARAYGSGGYASGTAETTGSYSGTTHDGAAAYEAKAHADEQNRLMMEQVKRTHSEQRNTLESRALRANTLNSGEYVDGDVLVELPKKLSRSSSQFELILSVGTDQFNFVLKEPH